MLVITAARITAVIFLREKLLIYSERISLLPGDWCAPCGQSHFVGQRLRDGQQDEADIRQGDERCHQDHQVISVVG